MDYAEQQAKIDQAVNMLVEVGVCHNGGPFNDLAAQCTLELLLRNEIRESVISAITKITEVWVAHSRELDRQ